MAYINSHELVITNAARYTVREARELIKDFRRDNPDITGMSLRSDRSLLREWACHALAYRWGIARDRSRDANLQFVMRPEVRLMYNILGRVAILILKACGR